jgi:hypothetical protein
MPFPALELSDLRGGRCSLPDLWRGRGAPAVVVIGHSDCGTTRLLLPYVDRIHRRRDPRSLVVAVLQDDPEAAGALRDELRLDLPIYLEADPYPLAQGLELTTVPTLLSVGPEGHILEVSEAFRRDDVEAFATVAGHPRPFFAPGDNPPALRPG